MAGLLDDRSKRIGAVPGLLGALRDPQFYRDMASNVPDAARGLLAQTAGTPVDIATMMMRPFGYKTPDANVVGSTDWIGKKLGADVERMPFRIASMLPTGADDLMRLGPAGAALLFHGSPHLFDKFDMSKVGTGEGHQAFGHGLYFAEERNVANEYKNALGGPGIEIDGKIKKIQPGSPEDIAIAHLEDAFYTQSSAPYIKAKNSLGSVRSAAGSDPRFEQAMGILDQWRNAGAKPATTGVLYKADIPDEQLAKILDLDAPISDQPAVVKKILADSGLYDPSATARIDEITKLKANLASDRLPNGAMRNEKQWHALSREQEKLIEKTDVKTGADVRRRLGDIARSYDGNELNQIYRTNGGNQDAAVSQFLKNRGIPGFRYLDQGSRTSGKGTHNYVIFDDQLPKIVGRE